MVNYSRSPTHGVMEYPEHYPDRRPVIMLGAPTVRPVSTIHGNYNADMIPPQIPFEDFAREVLNNEAQRIAWNVPTSSPRSGLIVPTGLKLKLGFKPTMSMMPSFLPRGNKSLNSALSGGLSRNTKIGLAVAGGLVVAGGAGYAVYRSRRSGR